MRSVKPGRAPSFMGGIMSIVVGAFGVFWTIMANSFGAPGFMVAFGVVFVLIALGGAVYNFINATGKNRFSEFDITDSREEPDPLNQKFGALSYQATSGADDPDDAGEYCPFCGAKLGEGFLYCRKCGKKLPE